MTLRQTLTMSVILHLAILDCSCGAATPAQREGYAAEVARCAANERAIVERPGTSEAEDAEALDTERARCDAALAATYGN